VLDRCGKIVQQCKLKVKEMRMKIRNDCSSVHHHHHQEMMTLLMTSSREDEEEDYLQSTKHQSGDKL
jgi:hypothetical protein